MNKNVLAIFVAALVIIGTAYTLSTPAAQTMLATTGVWFLDKTDDTPFAYGVLNDYLASGESITYPLVFNSITVSTADGEDPQIVFTPAYWERFVLTMDATELSPAESDGAKAALLAEGFVSEGTRTTVDGREGEVLAADQKAHPAGGAETCDIAYHYFIPRAGGSSVLRLAVRAAQSDWAAQSDTPCILFDEDNYADLTGMADHVIATIRP